MSSQRKRISSRRKPTGSRKRLQAQSERKRASNGSSSILWWVGGIAAVVIVGAVIEVNALGLWPAWGGGKAEPSEEESGISMPANAADRADMYSAPPEMQIDSSKTYIATISTAKGDITVQLDATAAPKTVNNFVFLSREGFYNGLAFHRVEPDFVIQGGDPMGTGVGGPGYTVPAEIQLLHVEGAIAMARRGDDVNPERASSGSQFYITLKATPFLDDGYTAFGWVIEGLDVVKSMAIGDTIERITITEE